MGARKRTLIRGIVIGTAILLLALVALTAYALHGWLWSVDMPVYGRLLRELPNPPGMLLETDTLDLTPYHPWGYRKYFVDADLADVETFFLTALPQQNWLLQEQNAPTTRQRRMLFARDQRYWLGVEIMEGTPRGGWLGKTLVLLWISRNEGEIRFHLGFR